MTPLARGPILVCYDGSIGARRAIEWVGSFLAGSVVVVLHVWDSPAVDGVFAVPPRDAEARRERAIAVALEGAELARTAGLEAQPLTAGIGASWQSIVAVAEEQHARLLVLGARGVSGLHAAALGSVSHGVAQHARIPVVVVPPSVEAGRPVAGAGGLERVLSRLSGSRSLDALARYVISEAGKGRELTHIFDDAYVRNRSDASTLQQLFDRRDVIDALGRDAVAELRTRIAAPRS